MADRDDDREPATAIARLRVLFLDALNRGDVAAACAVYAADAALLPPAGRLVRGRDEIAAFWSAGLRAGVTAIGLEAMEVRARGDLAYEIGGYALHLDAGAGRVGVERGLYLLVHERGADGWCRAAEFFTPSTK